MRAPEQVREYNKRYYARHKDKILEQGRAYREAHRDAIRQKDKKYRQSPSYKTLPFYKRKEERRKETVRWLEGIKLYYGCSNPSCLWDGAFSPTMLDFHHIDKTTKSFLVSHATSYKKMIAELNKCCVLCSNCHRIETHDGMGCSQFIRCNITDDGRVIGPV